MCCKQQNLIMQYIFPDEMIIENVTDFFLKKIDLWVWVIKILLYDHPLLHTTPSSWYDSFVDFTDWVDWVWNVRTV